MNKQHRQQLQKRILSDFDTQELYPLNHFNEDFEAARGFRQRLLLCYVAVPARLRQIGRTPSKGFVDTLDQALNAVVLWAFGKTNERGMREGGNYQYEVSPLNTFKSITSNATRPKFLFVSSKETRKESGSEPRIFSGQPFDAREGRITFENQEAKNFAAEYEAGKRICDLRPSPKRDADDRRTFYNNDFAELMAIAQDRFLGLVNDTIVGQKCLTEIVQLVEQHKRLQTIGDREIIDMAIEFASFCPDCNDLECEKGCDGKHDIRPTDDAIISYIFQNSDYSRERIRRVVRQLQIAAGRQTQLAV